MAAIARFRSFVGVAKETTEGTAVPATDFIPITADPKSSDKLQLIDDKSFRGSSVDVYGKVAGMKTGGMDLSGNTNLHSIGYLIQSILPDLTVTASTAPTGLATGTAGTGGTFAAGTYFWKVTAVSASGAESTGSNEVSATLTANQTQPLTWTTVSGAQSYNVYRGTAAGAENVLVGNSVTAAFTDTGTAGTAKTPPAANPYTTTFAALNSGAGQPKAYTFTDFDGDTARAFAGAHLDSLALKFKADGLLEYSGKVMSWGSVNLTVPTPSYSTLAPVAAYTGVIKVGGVQITNVQDCQLDFKRKCEYLETVQGTQNPYQVFSGPIAVTGKVTAVLLATDPMLAAYLANTTQNVSIAFGQGSFSLGVQMSSVVYSKADVQRGKDYVELALEFEAIGNTTDVGASLGYSPCKVTLVNDAPSGTYA